MRRDKPKTKIVRNSFIFLWRKCECCQKEIRLEFVWKFHVTNYNYGIRAMYSTHRVCKECCPSVEEAEAFAKALAKFINTLPPRPSPPKGMKRDIPKPPPVLNRRPRKHFENGL